MEEVVRDLLELFELDELFDHLDITPEEVLTILIEGGHVKVPEYLVR